MLAAALECAGAQSGVPDMEIYTTDEFEKLLGPPPADTPASAQTTLAALARDCLRG